MNVSGGFTASCGSCAPTHFVTNHYQTADDVSILRGKHFLQVYFDYIHEELNLAGLPIPKTANSRSTDPTPGLVWLICCWERRIPSRRALAPEPQPTFATTTLAIMLQDTWHATRGLTINAGLRWEPWFPEYEKNNIGGEFNQANFNANITSSVYVKCSCRYRLLWGQRCEEGFCQYPSHKLLSAYRGLLLIPPATARKAFAVPIL